jgi:hypothetical protein
MVMDSVPRGLTGTVEEVFPAHDAEVSEFRTERAEAVCDVRPDQRWQHEGSCSQLLRLHVRGLRLLEVTDSRNGRVRNGSSNH